MGIGLDQYMALRGRQLGGKKAQNAGASFENDFIRRCYLQGLYVSRIPDGCKQVSKDEIYRLKSPFDWIVTYHHEPIGLLNRRDQSIALLDTKSTEGKVFNHSDIKEKQVQELIKHEGGRVKAGYVVLLKEINRVIFIPASYLNVCIHKRGSVKPYSHPSVQDLGTWSDFDLKGKLFHA
jgi:hypothetical protein